jgi:3-isopropylmalate/(R)-2-methylmalate dehydratase large subunit
MKMSKDTYYDNVFDMHVVGQLPSGQKQLYVGRHLMHEVTSPQAFEMLRERGLKVRRPDLTYAVVDHIIPTEDTSRPYKDPQAELMAKTLEDNVNEFGITYFGPQSGKQGVCHCVFAEQGIVWPGQVVVCGDSHTSTYGALGALAFGIGTTQVSHVLATQTLAMNKLKVRKVEFDGLPNSPYVGPKDMVLEMIRKLGVAGGVGFAYELGGRGISDLDTEGRLTITNMGVEGGAQSCYVLPDESTFAYLKGKPFSPKDFDRAVEFWKSLVPANPQYDDIKKLEIKNLRPMLTWGVNPEQAIGINESMPRLEDFAEGKPRDEARDAFDYMGLKPGEYVKGTPVDIVFIGSCTNGRFEDLLEAAEILKDQKVKVKTLIVPGSQTIKRQAEEYGLDEIFKEAGAEWREPGCSMCLAMNPDKVGEKQRCASTSNRNFKKRQSGGLYNSRTHLMSPYSAAATAIEGAIADPRDHII